MGFDFGLSNIAGGIIDHFSAQHAANQAHDWAMQADNTKYQRTVKDMEKAGLNPGLAYMHGASAPSAAAPVAQTGQIGPAVSNAVNSSLASRRLDAEIKAIAEETKLKKENQEVAKADVIAKRAQAINSLATAKNAQQANEMKSPVASLSNITQGILDSFANGAKAAADRSTSKRAEEVKKFRKFLQNPDNFKGE